MQKDTKDGGDMGICFLPTLFITLPPSIGRALVSILEAPHVKNVLANRILQKTHEDWNMNSPYRKPCTSGP